MYSKISYWVIDVDGTMTDGGIYYDSNGNEWKKFNTKDGIGLLMLSRLDMKVIVLTGRISKAIEKRMVELKVQYLFQNVKDKVAFLERFMQENGICREQIAYIGDDLNDYYAMQLAEFKACPADACDEIKGCADYVSGEKGGEGAVRDVICYFLKKREEWENCLQTVCDAGI